MKFSEFGFDERILKGIEEVGFKECTEVQTKVFEQTLVGKDVVVQSQTGTGKTAAFLVSLFQRFLTGTDTKKALVIAPTRELAVQIEQEAQLLGKYCGLTAGSFFGGVSYQKQERLLSEGLNIYIGTPGRLIDFYKSKKLSLKDMEVVVIDEADRMFDMGFIKDIRFLLRQCPPAGKRLTMLFSATLGLIVKQMSWEFMQDPVDIEVDPENITVGKVDQVLYHVGSKDKFKFLLGLFKQEKPSGGLIFCNTRRMTEILAHRMNGNGYKTEFISGDLPQKKRLNLIERIKKGEVRFIVATDVAARGLHVEDLPLVVNYDLPEDVASYVHRIGRTGRAGKEGKAVSLVDEHSVYNLDGIQKFIEMKIPEMEVNEEMFEEDRSAPFKSNWGSTGRRDIKRDQNRISRESRPKRVTKPKASVVTKKEEVGKKDLPASVKAGRRKLSEVGTAKQKKPISKPTTPQNSKTNVQKERTQRRSSSESIQISGRVSRTMKLKERISFYEKKYGKEFKAKKKGILPFLQKLFGLD